MLIEKYKPEWVDQFNNIKDALEKFLQNLNFSIEHVGSTAVRGLDAKPIIDIDIIFYTKNDFQLIKTRLEKAGYYHNGNQGIEDRDVFKREGVQKHGILDAIPHHLYVCPANSKALERHLLSRNYLRKNEWARKKYQQMKYEIAERAGQDRKKYATLKEDLVNNFIDIMIQEERNNQ